MPNKHNGWSDLENDYIKNHYLTQSDSELAENLKRIRPNLPKPRSEVSVGAQRQRVLKLFRQQAKANQWTTGNGYEKPRIERIGNKTVHHCFS